MKFVVLRTIHVSDGSGYPMAAWAPRVVRRAVMMVMAISATLFNVFFVDSFIGLTPDPSLNKEGSIY